MITSNQKNRSKLFAHGQTTIYQANYKNGPTNGKTIYLLNTANVYNKIRPGFIYTWVTTYEQG